VVGGKNQNPLTIDIVIPSIRKDVGTLSSMLRINVPPDVKLSYYIVVDNPSLSSMNLMHDGHPIQFIVNAENLGAPMSRNVGLERGTGEYIFFLDDDVTPSPDILFSYVSAIRNNPDAPGYVGPTTFPNPINAFTKGIRASDILTFFDISLNREWVAWGTTSNLLVSRKKVGNIRFSASFPKHGGGEDIDFCLRIIANDDKWFKTVPEAAVYHDWWKNGRRTYTRFFRWAYGDSRLPDMYPKNRFYNFPNMVETLSLGIPIFAGLSLASLFSLHSIGLWIGLVVFSEFVVELSRVKTRYPNSSVRDAFEATVVRLSNDLGRVVGSLRRGDITGFLKRFDYFMTKESVSFERKIALTKFIPFLFSITAMFMI
jgi:glycosyltransferase involved in cell wall biosynthesis